MFLKKYKITENNITYDIREYQGDTKYWYLNYKYHRENGPAIEYSDGSKYWYINGRRHRDDGPACEFHSGIKEYWYNGKHLIDINSDEELKRYIKLLSIY